MDNGNPDNADNPGRPMEALILIAITLTFVALTRIALGDRT